MKNRYLDIKVVVAVRRPRGVSAVSQAEDESIARRVKLVLETQAHLIEVLFDAVEPDV